MTLTAEQKEKYIQETLVGQMKWHDNKATINQKWYKRIRITVLIVSATIPFMSGLVGDKGMGFIPFAIGIAGIIVTVSEGLLILNKYQENWVDYRKIAESLRREKSYYEMDVGLYATAEDPFKLLVEEVGAILGQEVSNWSDRVKEGKGKDNV